MNSAFFLWPAVQTRPSSRQRLQGDSPSHCRGRNQSAPPLKNKCGILIKLTFVFFILHLSQAFQTLLCLPSPISGLRLPLDAAALAAALAAVTLFAPLGPGLELFVRLLAGFLCVTSLSVDGGEGRDGGCGGGILWLCVCGFEVKSRLWDVVVTRSGRS